MAPLTCIERFSVKIVAVSGSYLLLSNGDRRIISTLSQEYTKESGQQM